MLLSSRRRDGLSEAQELTLFQGHPAAGSGLCLLFPCLPDLAVSTTPSGPTPGRRPGGRSGSAPGWMPVLPAARRWAASQTEEEGEFE